MRGVHPARAAFEARYRTGFGVACGRAEALSYRSRQGGCVHVQTDTRARLRQEVGSLRVRESRRRFDATINVGRLAGERQSFVVRAQDLPVLDAALRIDVVSSLVDSFSAERGENTGREQAADRLTAWVTRPGSPASHDMDLQWLAAGTTAFAMHGRTLTGFYAVTRYGWLDVRTEESRIWKRLRL